MTYFYVYFDAKGRSQFLKAWTIQLKKTHVGILLW